MEYWWHRILGCFCYLFLSTSDIPKTKNLKEELFPFRSCNLIIALQTYKPVQRASRPQCPPLGKCWIKVFFLVLSQVFTFPPTVMVFPWWLTSLPSSGSVRMKSMRVCKSTSIQGTTWSQHILI